MMKRNQRAASAPMVRPPPRVVTAMIVSVRVKPNMPPSSWSASSSPASGVAVGCGMAGSGGVVADG